MSFTIKFSPKRYPTQNGIKAELLVLDVSTTDPDFAKHSRYATLLCTQSNQISGKNSEFGEYDVNSSWREGFCRLCNNLSTSHVPEGMHPIVKGGLHDFEISASNGCKICELVLKAVSPYKGPGRLKAYIKPGAALNILIKTADKNARYDLFTKTGSRPSPWPGIGQANFIAKNSADDDVIDLLRTWLRDCKAHERCKQQNLLKSPIRIINAGHDQLRLEEPATVSKPYIALSHCWGGSTNVPRATKKSISSLKNRIDWNLLTKTFQDAILLTRKLGLQYIWIDSLCIIQDDKRDWHTQISEMASIYENAELVVSATASKDGSGGIFRDRKPEQILASTDAENSLTVRECGSRYNPIVFDLGGGGEPINFIVRDTARHAQWDSFDLIAQSSVNFNPLLGRAWAFQERLLATRIVHFADHELVWECKQMERCECMHLDHSGGRPVLERGNENMKLMFSRALHSPNSEPLDPYQLWARIIENFNERELTVEKDRLPALAGAVQVFQRERPDVGPCVAGLFLHEIPRCMLWRVPDPGIRHDVYTAPTWSWASVILPTQKPPRVQYLWHTQDTSEAYPFHISEPCIEKLSILRYEAIITKEDGLLEPTALRFRGLMISATLIIETFDTLDIRSLRDQPGFGFMLYDPPLRDYQYFVAKNGQKQPLIADVLLHVEPNNLPSGSQIFLMAVARGATQKEANNLLVLKRLENKRDFATHARIPIGTTLDRLEDPAYARIGMIHSSKQDLTSWFDNAKREPVIIF